jgi:hypothetical protein
MGLAELQRALARLTVDRTLRERFYIDPAAACAAIGLDSYDCQQLTIIPRHQIERFAKSICDKRQAQIRRTIPIAARAMGARFTGLCERYTNESAPRGSKADLDDPAGFVDALSRWADSIEPPWVVDLARYELTWRLAARADRAPILRIFKFPVARLAIGGETKTVVPRATLCFWWRPTRHGRGRHFVLSLPNVREIPPSPPNVGPP